MDVFTYVLDYKSQIHFSNIGDCFGVNDPDFGYIYHLRISSIVFDSCTYMRMPRG